MKKFLRSISFFLVVASLVVTTGVPLVLIHAQAIPSFADVEIDIMPKFPEPYQQVDIEAISYSVALDTRTVTWYVNNQEYQKGVGKKSISIRMGGPGSTTNVRISVDVGTSDPVVKSIELKPNVIDLLWEAIDSYVPPFYKGKALPAAEGAIRVTAIPSGSSTLNGMVFTWLRNNEVSQSDSGFGRNSLSLRNTIFDTVSRVGVRVLSPDGRYQAEKSLSIARGEPFLRFGVYKPGSMPRFATTNGFLDAPSGNFELRVEPFFLSSRNGYSGLNYKWIVSGEDYVNQEKKTNSIYLSPLGENATVPFDVSLSHFTYTLQELKGKISINF